MMMLMMEKLVAASSVDSVAVGKIRPAQLQLGSRAAPACTPASQSRVSQS